jgi:hypothetical protein
MDKQMQELCENGDDNHDVINDDDDGDSETQCHFSVLV